MHTSKLIHVLPVGGWENVLKLQAELLQANVLGIGTTIISVLDGDIQQDCQQKKEYKDLTKLFLPIASVEKFLYKVLYKCLDRTLKKVINDKYFQLKPIDKIISDFNQEYPSLPKQPDKKFYFRLKNDLENRKISEENFIYSLCEEILKVINFDSFSEELKKKLC